MWKRSTKSRSWNIRRQALRVPSSSKFRSSNAKSCSWKYADDGILRRCRGEKVKFRQYDTSHHHKNDGNKKLPLGGGRHLSMPMHDSWEPRAWHSALPSPQLLSHTCAYCGFPFHRKSQTLPRNFHRFWWTPKREEINKWLRRFIAKAFALAYQIIKFIDQLNDANFLTQRVLDGHA